MVLGELREVTGIGIHREEMGQGEGAALREALAWSPRPGPFMPRRPRTGVVPHGGSGPWVQAALAKVKRCGAGSHAWVYRAAALAAGWSHS